MKKILTSPALSLYSCLVLALFSVGVGKVGAVCEIDPAGTYIEAEYFSGSYNLNGSPDAGDQFSPVIVAGTNNNTVLQSGYSGSQNTTPLNEVKEYTVDFTTTGTYRFWARGSGENSGRDSMFFSIEGGPWKAWTFAVGTYDGSYIWTNNMQVGGDNSYNVTTVGTKKIRIAMREPNARIDGFYITTGSETPDDATVPTSVTSLNPQVGCIGSNWTASPNSLGPTSFVNFDASSTSLTITNVGTDDVNPAVVTSDQPWAIVNNGNIPPLTSGGTHTITLTYNTSAMTAGTYQAELTVTGSAINSGLTIPITLIVKQVPNANTCGEVPLYADNLLKPAIMVQLDTSGSMNSNMTIAAADDQETGDLDDVVQEVVDRIGWVSGNDMGFVITGSGTRRAWSADGDQASAPQLMIRYRVGGGSDVTFTKSIQGIANDAQVSGATIVNNATFLELGRANDPVGLRFTNVTIPQGANIREARLIFSPYQGDTNTTNLSVYGIDDDDVNDITDFSTATLTSQFKSWNPGSWSDSMSRINIAEDVLSEVFLDRSIDWGFATWSGGNGNASQGNNAPTYFTNFRIGTRAHDDTHQANLQTVVDDGSPGGWTPLVPTMRGGLEYFKGNRTDSTYNERYTPVGCQPRILVVVTDGLGNSGTNNAKIDTVVDDLTGEEITIVTVGFGLTNATQLDRIAQRMQIAGEANDVDFLYHLHNENTSGVAVPFLAQNRKEFIDAMNSIVKNVKAQVFTGSNPAPTTSAGNDEILLNAQFNASDWTGNLTAIKFDPYTGGFDPTFLWQSKEQMPADIDDINGYIYDNSAAIEVSKYTDASINGDNFLCKPMGDIINSTPVIVGAPLYFYEFDSYLSFKYKNLVRNREEMAYIGANDGALHAFNLNDGKEKWRFYPDSVKDKLSLAASDPKDDMCSSSYCHQFLLDGSPQAADILDSTSGEWRTILTTGLGRGGSAFFALDVTYGQDFVADPHVSLSNISTEVASKFLWEFTAPNLGLATGEPVAARVINGTTSTGWATFFGSGRAQTDLLQVDKQAYIYAVNSYDGTEVWNDNSTPVVSTHSVKLSTTELKGDISSPILVVDSADDDYKYDRIYAGNRYHNMYRLQDIGFGQSPTSTLYFDGETTDHSNAITAMPEYAYAGDNDIWLYFGTGKYEDQVDKFTIFPQYFYGLFDEDAAKATAYKQADLTTIKTSIIEGYALNDDGTKADIDNSGTAGDAGDLRRYRTLFCDAPDADGKCNAANNSWLMELVVPNDSGSERVITKALAVGGIVFFATFIPDGDVCAGNGETWLFAVDWETGDFVTDAVFDINENGDFDGGDKNVEDTGGNTVKVGGIFVGNGRPSSKIVISNNILTLGLSGGGNNGNPPTIPVNLPRNRTQLRGWEQIFN